MSNPSTSQTPFDVALKFTLEAEGGFVVDQGGPTNFGITQTTYDEWLHKHSMKPVGVRGLTLNVARLVYRDMVWEPAQCDQLPLHLAICHFDWSVNHGVHGATKTLQATVGANPDGVWGPKSQAALEGLVAKVSPDILCANYNNLRTKWYQDNAHGVATRDLVGWLNRVERLKKYLRELES